MISAVADLLATRSPDELAQLADQLEALAAGPDPLATAAWALQLDAAAHHRGTGRVSAGSATPHQDPLPPGSDSDSSAGGFER